MSKFDQINAFISIVEENSFIKAAQKLGISAAAISRQLARLEASLRIELLYRTTRKVQLTEAGEHYYQQCKMALDVLKDAELAMGQDQKEVTGTLYVTCNRYFAIHYILPHIAEFMAQNPMLKINLELAERFPDLIAEKVDLVFGVSVEGSEDLVRKKFTTTRYIACASPGYLKQYGTPKKPSELAEHRYITHSIRNPENVVIFKDNQKILVNPILSLNDSVAMRECAIQGLGIVKLHEYMVKEAIQNGTLIEILKTYQKPTTPIYLYYRQSRYLQAKIRKFIDFYTARIT